MTRRGFLLLLPAVAITDGAIAVGNRGATATTDTGVIVDGGTKICHSYSADPVSKDVGGPLFSDGDCCRCCRLCSS